MIKLYSGEKVNKLGKWYPSDLEPMTRLQKIIMNKMKIDYKKIKSGRKAEMEIEDRVIKKIIDDSISKGIYKNINITKSVNVIPVKKIRL